MPTRPCEAVVADHRKKWSAETAKLSERLASQLREEVSAQVAFGRRISTAREAARMSQPQLARKSGVQQADISRIERGLGNPTRDTLMKLADALGMQLTLVPKDSHNSQSA